MVILANEKDKNESQEKNVLQKLKRLMTITEKDVIDENEQDEALDNIADENQESAITDGDSSNEKKEKAKNKRHRGKKPRCLFLLKING